MRKIVLLLVVIFMAMMSYVYAQPDGNGIFNISGFKINGTDENNTGIGNWTIMLSNETGNIATTLTEEDGSYTFENLTNGTYNVTEGTKEGWTNVSPMIQEATIDNQNVSDINFTNMLSPTSKFNISGFKINGTDENNTGIGNWAIMLFDADGNKIATTKTQEDGSYTFTNLTNGTYNVTEGMRKGWTNVSPMTQEVTVDNGDEPDVNFTNMLIPPVSKFNISGFKINGTDENNMGIENWNVMLFDNKGRQMAKTITQSDGSYNFTNLTNGTYEVVEGMREGWTNVSPMKQEVVIDNGDESDVNFTNMLAPPGPPGITNHSPESPFVSNANEAITFMIAVNQSVNVTWNLDGSDVKSEEDMMSSHYTNSNATIGTHILDANVSNPNGEDSFEWNWTVQNISVENVGVINGTVFNDINHNKKKNKGEKGISGVQVKLKGADVSNKNIILTTKTNKNGRYTFDNLPLGHYRVILGHKKGFVATTRTNVKIDLTANKTVRAVNFGDRKH